MKKCLRLALVFVLVLALSLPAFAQASVARASDYISSYTATASVSGKTVTIQFYVYGTEPMDQIGASQIRVYEKLPGGSWDEIADLRPEDPGYGDLVDNNRSMYSASVSFTGRTDCSYYAVVEVFASKDGGEDTAIKATNVVTVRS